VIRMQDVLPPLAQYAGVDPALLPRDSQSGRYEPRTFPCLLPGHEDQCASAGVRYCTGRFHGWYHCFGCGANLGVLQLVKAVTGAEDAFDWVNGMGISPALRSTDPDDLCGYGESQRYVPSWIDD
jgi:hypothetical protein